MEVLFPDKFDEKIVFFILLRYLLYLNKLQNICDCLSKVNFTGSGEDNPY